MENKICPLRAVAGFVNGKQICDKGCTLFVKTNEQEGCAIAVLAEGMAAAATSADYIVENLEEIGGRI